MRNDDPWAAIRPDPDRMLGRRIESEHVLGIYWVVSADDAPGLLIRGIENVSVPKTLPRPRGIALRTSSEGDHASQLSLFLLMPEDRDVFLALCQDVIAHSSDSQDPATAAASVFRRLEHWQSLLSQGRSAELAPHEVRGLIGELWMLDQLVQRKGASAAIPAWVAPDQHPQDFALQTAIVEVKARLAGSRPQVSVSSLEQLESSHLPLYLLVVELAPGKDGALSLNQMAERLLAHAGAEGSDVQEQADAALARRGYMASPRYDEPRYTVSGTRLFEVAAGFPRLIRSSTDRRIASATYCIDLTAVADFERSNDCILTPASAS